MRGRPNGTPLARREAAASTGSKPDLSEQGQSPARFGMQSTARGSAERSERAWERAGRPQVLLVADEGAAASAVEALLAARGDGVTGAALGEPGLFAQALGRWLRRRRGGAVPKALRAARARRPAGRRRVARSAGLRWASWTPSPARAGPTSSPAHPGWWSWPTRSAMANGSCGCPAPGTSRRRAAARWRTWGALARHRRQGRVVRVPSESFDVAGLFPAAPDVIGGPVRVRAVTPLVYRVFTPSRAHSKAASPRPSPMGCWREGRRPATTRPSPAEAATLRA